MRIVGSVLLLVGSGLLALVVAELALRAFAPQHLEPHPRGLYVSHPTLGFALAPGLDGESRSPEWDVRVRTNAHGLREDELPAPAVGERRLLVIGDSFTFGAGVEAEAAYPHGIETALRAAGRTDVRVVNAGVPAYGTRQEAGLVAALAGAVQPDAVLLGFFLGNDFYDNLDANTYEIVSGYLVPASSDGTNLQLSQRLGISPELKIALRTKLHLYVLAMNAWSAALTRTGLADTDESFDVYRRQPTASLERAVAATRAALRELRETCRERELPLGIALLPDLRMRAIVEADPQLSFDAPASRLRGIVGDWRVPVLDLTAPMRDLEDAVFPVDGHWNAKGHRAAGRLIARSLLHGELAALLGAR